MLQFATECSAYRSGWWEAGHQKTGLTTTPCPKPAGTDNQAKETALWTDGVQSLNTHGHRG